MFSYLSRNIRVQVEPMLPQICHYGMGEDRINFASSRASNNVYGIFISWEVPSRNDRIHSLNFDMTPVEEMIKVTSSPGLP